MEILNGTVKKVVGRSKIEALDMGRSNSNHRNRRILWGLILASTLSIGGCSLSKIKTGLMTGAATTAVVGATTALTGGAIVPTAVVGGTTAAVASALTAEPSVKGEPVSITADTVVNKAPDNFWTLFGKLISMGGWALILIVIVPMLFSWLMPGPIQFKGKKKK
tara:strand:- start:648 stop:1139 length:492 start_codon:yes stop_codon:yes gene_type:complete